MFERHSRECRLLIGEAENETQLRFAFSFLRLHIPEFPPQNFPYDALGKGGDELNQLRYFVSRKLFFAEVNDLFRRHGLARFCNNKNLYGLSAIGIGNADGAHFQNLRMRDQQARRSLWDRH